MNDLLKIRHRLQRLPQGKLVGEGKAVREEVDAVSQSGIFLNFQEHHQAENFQPSLEEPFAQLHVERSLPHEDPDPLQGAGFGNPAGDCLETNHGDQGEAGPAGQVQLAPRASAPLDPEIPEKGER